MNALHAFWERYEASIRRLIRQIMWFGTSLLLALIVWIAATSEGDPINERIFPVPVPVRRVNLEPDVILVNEDEFPETARVTIRAPQSVWDRLRENDIDVRADFQHLRSGSHVLPIQASLSLPGEVVSTQPSQVAVELDMRSRKTVPVHIAVTGTPAVGFEAREPQLAQGEVSAFGPASLVEMVTEAYAEISVEGESVSVQDQIALQARTQDEALDNVQLDPATLQVTVPIQAREGFRTVSVRPDIRGRPPLGYTWQLEIYTPETITVTGQQTRLDSMTEAVLTEPIELLDRTESFERNVGVILPRGITPVTEQTVTVKIAIDAMEGFREFDEIPVESHGLPTTYRAEITPASVTVLITGPMPVLNTLTNEDIRVVVNLEGLEPDRYQLPLEPIVAVEGFEAGQISLLPSVVAVQVIDTEATPTAAPSPTPTVIAVTPNTPTPEE